MDRLWSVVAAVLLFQFSFWATPAARAQAKTVEIPFSQPGGLMVIDATINGKAVALLFDSGAMRTFVNPSIIDGLKQTSGKAVSLSDGNVVGVRVVRTSITVGGASVDVDVSAYDITRFADGIGLRINGVLGQDVIGKFSGVLIDYVRHRITLIQ